MENKKRALGRGLEQLFNNENLDLNQIEEKIYETATADEIIEIPLAEIRFNPYQPRTSFSKEAIEELAHSIKEHGVFQPIIVKKGVKGFQLVAGERRVRACRELGMETIPAIIRDLTDEQMMEIALLENLQRENLSAVEEAYAYQSLMTKFNITQDNLAKKVGKSRSHITNILGLLKLPDEVQKMVNEKSLTMGHARVLSKLENGEQIKTTAKEIVNKGLSVRALEEQLNNQEYQRTRKIKRQTPSDYALAEQLLSDKLDVKVKIHDKKIIINFENKADLARILEVLDVKE